MWRELTTARPGLQDWVEHKREKKRKNRRRKVRRKNPHGMGKFPWSSSPIEWNALQITSLQIEYIYNPIFTILDVSVKI